VGPKVRSRTRGDRQREFCERGLIKSGGPRLTLELTYCAGGVHNSRGGERVRVNHGGAFNCRNNKRSGGNEEEGMEGSQVEELKSGRNWKRRGFVNGLC